MHKIHDHISNHIEHVIWDWNGTLLSDIDHAVETVNRLLEEHNLPLTSLERYKDEFGFPVLDYYERLGFKTTQAEFLELCETFNRYFVDGLDRCALWPGAIETLTKIHSSGRKQSILSASYQELLDWSVEKFGIRHLLHHVVGVADKTASSKVSRGHELITKAMVDPKKTLLIGDTDHDLEVATALGIDAILVDHGHQSKARLIAVHHNVVSVIDEI